MFREGYWQNKFKIVQNKFPSISEVKANESIFGVPQIHKPLDENFDRIQGKEKSCMESFRVSGNQLSSSWKSRKLQKIGGRLHEYWLLHFVGD